MMWFNVVSPSHAHAIASTWNGGAVTRRNLLEDEDEDDPARSRFIDQLLAKRRPQPEQMKEAA